MFPVQLTTSRIDKPYLVDVCILYYISDDHTYIYAVENILARTLVTVTVPMNPSISRYIINNNSVLIA